MFDLVTAAESRRADYNREAEEYRRSNERVVTGRGLSRSRRTIGRMLIKAGSAIADPTNEGRR